MLSQWVNFCLTRLTGWRVAALGAGMMAYGYWFTGPGPYGDLAMMHPLMPFESQISGYPGSDVIAAFETLSSREVMTKTVSLIFDIPFMLLFFGFVGALWAFIIRRFGWQKVARLTLGLVLLGLVCDAIENTGLLLALWLNWSWAASLAGMITPVKFGAAVISFGGALILSPLAALFWLTRRGQTPAP